ncbi:type II toxin-antitoxin system TacA family antitoxin [Mesorhizobium atlanticum]
MAEDTLLERTLIKASPDAYAEFLVLLDAPAKSNEGLSKLMNAPLPWEAK